MASATEVTKSVGKLPFYSLSADEALGALKTGKNGLSKGEAHDRVQIFGTNNLAERKRKPAILRYLAHFDDILIYILLVSAGLKAIVGDWVDFTVILVAAVAIATIGFIQEGQAEDALDGIRKMLSLEAEVLRDGQWTNEDATLIVPGDIIRVKGGDRIPADIRLIESTNLRVDEAALTGESEPSEKDTKAVSQDAGVGDRSSMLFSSSIVTSGTGIGVVTATGMHTEIGRISAMVDEVEEMDTPLTRKLADLSKAISIGIGILVVVMILVGRLVHDWPIDELISAAIGFAVAAVPEGLPALVTITLAMGVRQMAKSNAITRKMASVETLGSVTTICSDKTGTLTQNEMTCKVGVTRDEEFKASGTGYQPEGAISVTGSELPVTEHPNLVSLIGGGAMTADAQIEKTQEGWRVVGAPTEGALTVLAGKAGLTGSGSRLAEVPFDSEHKFSASLDEMPGGELVLHVLGAPDRLLDRASTESDAQGASHPLERSAWDKKNDELSSQGLRVLAVAEKPIAEGTDQISLNDVEDLTFVGLLGIVDPPRPEAVKAIAEAQQAGINVKMITGDHAGTAVAIARELGIIDPQSSNENLVLTGSELQQMSQDELRQKAQNVNVFARTSPEHKIRIVRALQSKGEIVAMTGDGVNDAPSITRANVGVAMGIKGTEATKDAADIVLADDNFATIEKAVEEGRRIFDNIRKSVVFLLPTNGAQSLVILVAVLFGWTLPLSPVQILWINLVTAVTLSLPLAAEPAEPGIMNRPPRDAREHILSGRYVTLIVLVSLMIGGLTLGVFKFASGAGQTHAEAQTTAVTMLAFAQLAFLLSSRFLNASSLSPRVLRGNRLIWIAAISMIALQLIFVYAPFMNGWFGSAPIGGRAWLLIVGLSLALFLVVELIKAIGRYRDRAPRLSRAL